MAHAIFISYSSRDQSLADTVCTQLESAAIRCWIAPRDPAPGLPYGQQIAHAITQCQIVLLVFSSHSNESRAVLGEIELAANRGKIILPLRIEAIEPSEQLEFYIRSVHWHNALEALATKVRGLLAASTDDNADMTPAGVVGTVANHPLEPATNQSVPERSEANIPAAELAALTAQLARYVGPVARILARRHAEKSASVAALREALGTEIPNPVEREQFLAATRPHGVKARPWLRSLNDN